MSSSKKGNNDNLKGFLWSDSSSKTKNGSASKTNTNICSYGEDCYRQNPNHFEEFSHPHLSELVSKIPDGEFVFPPGYKQKISRRILEIQIGFQRNIKKYGVAAGKKDNNGSNNRLSNGVGNQSYRKDENKKIKVDTNKTSSFSPISKPSTSSSSNNLTASFSATDSSRANKTPSTSSANETNAANYRTVVMDRINHNIADKWRDAAPYHFFLSAITGSTPTHLERLTVHFPELLDPKLGDLKASLQINFMVELGWLLAQYHIMGHKGKPMTLLYGEAADDNMPRCPKHVTSAKITCPTSFGSHHTKMSVMLYTDNSIRVIVSTGNLVESDWDNRTQGVWIGPSCPQLPENCDTGSGESPTGFKKDLLQYLAAYKLPALQEWIGHVRRADLSDVRVFFIASVPGLHVGLDYENWSQGKLRNILNRHATVKPSSAATKWPIICQCSSIGSLGPQPSSWLNGQLKLTFSSGKGLSFPATDISLIYPSFDNVYGSHDGLLGGGCLPYSKKTHEKQLWLHAFLRQWKSDGRHRSKGMPHIKTYCRISPDHTQLAWFLMTSANLSKAAWGNSKAPGKNYILSYEAGVLFLPKFLIDQDTFLVKKDTATGSGSGSNGSPPFPMPYDVPLTPYGNSDVPWFFDNFNDFSLNVH